MVGSAVVEGQRSSLSFLAWWQGWVVELYYCVATKCVWLKIWFGAESSWLAFTAEVVQHWFCLVASRGAGLGVSFVEEHCSAMIVLPIVAHFYYIYLFDKRERRVIFAKTSLLRPLLNNPPSICLQYRVWRGRHRDQFWRCQTGFSELTWVARCTKFGLFCKNYI